MRSEGGGERLVVCVKQAAGFVQDLHHPYEHVLVVDQRQRQHATRVVAGRFIDARVETRIGITVRNIDDLPLSRASADKAGSRRHAHRLNAGRHFQDQFIGRRIVEPDRAAIRAQDLLGGSDDFSEHCHQVEWRR